MAGLFRSPCTGACYAGRRSLVLRVAADASLIGTALPMSVSRSAILAVARRLRRASSLGWPARWRLRALLVLPFAVVGMRLLAPGLVGTIRSLFANLVNDPSVTGRTDDYSVVLAPLRRAPAPRPRPVHLRPALLPDPRQPDPDDPDRARRGRAGGRCCSSWAPGSTCARAARRRLPTDRDRAPGAVLSARDRRAWCSATRRSTPGASRWSPALTFLLVGLAGAAHRLSLSRGTGAGSTRVPTGVEAADSAGAVVSRLTRVAVVVVTFNSAALLPDLARLAARRRRTPRSSWHLVVVDNDSTDGTVPVLRRAGPGGRGRRDGPQRRLRRRHQRRRRARRADQDAYLVLNPDVRLAPGLRARGCWPRSAEPGVGIAVPHLVDGARRADPVACAASRPCRGPSPTRLLGAERAGRVPALGEVVSDPARYRHRTRHRLGRGLHPAGQPPPAGRPAARGTSASSSTPRRPTSTCGPGDAASPLCYVPDARCRPPRGRVGHLAPALGGCCRSTACGSTRRGTAGAATAAFWAARCSARRAGPARRRPSRRRGAGPGQSPPAARSGPARVDRRTHHSPGEGAEAV